MQGRCEMRIDMQSEKCLCVVTFVGGGDNSTWGHARWTQGEKCFREVTFVWWRGQFNMRHTRWT